MAVGRVGPGRSEWDGSWQRFVEHVQSTPGRLPVPLRREVFRAAGGRSENEVGETRDDGSQREIPEELAAFADDVATRSDEVTDDQIAQLRDAGYSEDEIFEVIVVAAVGAASAHLDAARRAVEGG